MGTVDPMKSQGVAARVFELWLARSRLQLPLMHSLRWRLFEREFIRAMPWLLLLSVAMAGFLFASLPRLAGSAYLGLLVSLWGVWVEWAVPGLVGLAIAASVAPRLAADLLHRELGGEFELLAQNGYSPAVYPGLPMLVAMAQLGAACAMLVLLGSLCAGLLVHGWVGVGDHVQVLHAVLGAVHPLMYAAAALKAGLMLAFASLAVIVQRWPVGVRERRVSVLQGFALQSMAWALMGALLAAAALMWLEYALGVFQ